MRKLNEIKILRSSYEVHVIILNTVSSTKLTGEKPLLELLRVRFDDVNCMTRTQTTPSCNPY